MFGCHSAAVISGAWTSRPASGSSGTTRELKFKGTGSETGTTDFPYYLWVDQFNASGLGKDTVIVTGTTSDAHVHIRSEEGNVQCVPSPLPDAVSTLVVWMVELTTPTRVGRAEAFG